MADVSKKKPTTREEGEGEAAQPAARNSDQAIARPTEKCDEDCQEERPQSQKLVSDGTDG